ncbi:MAG: hypothetical protein WBN93_10225 [Acidimicrobiia bacterium]
MKSVGGCTGAELPSDHPVGDNLIDDSAYCLGSAGGERVFREVCGQAIEAATRPIDGVTRAENAL